MLFSFLCGADPRLSVLPNGELCSHSVPRHATAKRPGKHRLLALLPQDLCGRRKPAPGPSVRCVANAHAVRGVTGARKDPSGYWGLREREGAWAAGAVVAAA